MHCPHCYHFMLLIVIFLYCYYKQAAYEAEGEVQLATEPLAPGALTWGDTPQAVAYIADTMKGKESSKRKDMSLYPIWNCLLSIQLPLNLVQVSTMTRLIKPIGRGGIQRFKILSFH